MTPRAKQDARSRLIEAGAALAVAAYQDGGGPAALAFLTPAAVAARAGVSRSAIYHNWPARPGGVSSFEAYLSELADTLNADTIDASELALIALGLPPDLHRIVEVFAAGEAGVDVASTQFAVWRAGAAVAIAGAAVGASIDQMLDDLGRIYEAIIGHSGRVIVAPYTWRHMAAAVFALTDGMNLQRSANVDTLTATLPSDEPDPDCPWTVYAAAVEGILLHFTEPEESAAH